VEIHVREMKLGGQSERSVQQKCKGLCGAHKRDQIIASFFKTIIIMYSSQITLKTNDIHSNCLCTRRNILVEICMLVIFTFILDTNLNPFE